MERAEFLQQDEQQLLQELEDNPIYEEDDSDSVVSSRKVVEWSFVLACILNVELQCTLFIFMN